MHFKILLAKPPAIFETGIWISHRKWRKIMKYDKFRTMKSERNCNSRENHGYDNLWFTFIILHGEFRSELFQTQKTVDSWQNHLTAFITVTVTEIFNFSAVFI